MYCGFGQLKVNVENSQCLPVFFNLIFLIVQHFQQRTSVNIFLWFSSLIIKSSIATGCHCFCWNTEIGLKRILLVQAYTWQHDYNKLVISRIMPREQWKRTKYLGITVVVYCSMEVQIKSLIKMSGQKQLSSVTMSNWDII